MANLLPQPPYCREDVFTSAPGESPFVCLSQVITSRHSDGHGPLARSRSKQPTMSHWVCIPLDNQQPMPFFPSWGRKCCPPKGLLDPTPFFLGLSQRVLPGVLAPEQRFPGATPLGVAYHWGSVFILRLITAAKSHI